MAKRNKYDLENRINIARAAVGLDMQRFYGTSLDALQVICNRYELLAKLPAAKVNGTVLEQRQIPAKEHAAILRYATGKYWGL